MSKEKEPSLKVQVDEQFLERMKEFWNSIEELLQLPERESGELPCWVGKIQGHLNQTIYFHLKVLSSGIADAYKMGLAIGAMKKMVHVMGDAFEKLDKVKIEYEIPPHLIKRFEEQARKWSDLLIPDDDVRGIQILAYGYLVYAFENWNWRKAREFFKGVSDGLGSVKTTDDNWVRARSNTEILIFLLWNWNTVDKHIESVHHLHRWLGNYFTRNQLGEYKRVEKICERIQLKLAPAGRPKRKTAKKAKKKIPTKHKKAVGIKKS